MNRDNTLAELREQIAELHHKVYSSAGEAFAHVAVREYFGLDDEDALEYCDVGSGHDKGVDAFWIDDDERRAVLVHAKWADTAKSFRADVVREADSSYKWLLRVAEGGTTNTAPRVLDAARQLARVRQIEPDFPVQLFVIVAGSFTKGAHEEQARMADDLRGDNVEVVLVTLEELLEEVEERLSREGAVDESKPEVTLTLRDGGFFEHGGDPRALVATLSGYQLAEAARTWGYRLFVRNLRFMLPQRGRGSVNVGIKHTLESADGRERFWYYNNGIAIVCDSYEIAPDQTSVTVTNMQIVNGAQTTASLQNAIELLRGDATATVLARIIAEPDEELRQNITFFNNRQNAVKDRDLQSNDPTQDRLHAEFLSLDPPWFYERKRGEWNALTAHDARLKQRVGKRRIDNERVAQAGYAFYFNPARARADKKNLFQPKRDGGYYEDIFNETTYAVWLLLPYKLAECIRLEKNDYLKEIRDIERRKASVAQKRLLGRQWLKFADQFILGAMALYIENRGGFGEERLEELLGPDFDAMAKGMYHAAVRDLHGLFNRKEREATAKRDAGTSDEVFSAANYVKGNWEEALSHLHAEWDAREAVGDALAGIPMLCYEDFETGRK